MAGHRAEDILAASDRYAHTGVLVVRFVCLTDRGGKRGRGGAVVVGPAVFRTVPLRVRSVCLSGAVLVGLRGSCS